jgi:hypothetical protein
MGFRFEGYNSIRSLVSIAHHHGAHLVVASATLSPAQRVDMADFLHLAPESFRHLVIDDIIVKNIQLNLIRQRLTDSNASTKKNPAPNNNNINEEQGEKAEKYTAIVSKILDTHKEETGIVFIQCKEEALKLAEVLCNMGYVDTYAYYSINPEDQMKIEAAQKLMEEDPARAHLEYPQEYFISFPIILQRWIDGDVKLLISTDCLLVGVDNPRVTYSITLHLHLIRCQKLKLKGLAGEEKAKHSMSIRQMAILVNAKYCLEAYLRSYFGWSAGARVAGEDNDDNMATNVPTCLPSRPCTYCREEHKNSLDVGHAQVNPSFIHRWLDYLRDLSRDNLPAWHTPSAASPSLRRPCP